MQDVPIVTEDSGEEAWVLVAKAGSGDVADLADLSLVLSAVGIDQQIDRQNGVILTQQKDADQAMKELRAFREENRYWPPPPSAVRPAVYTDNPLLRTVWIGYAYL